MSDRNGLDTFDHVVVLMLENRSFDNLLGYLYPSGKQFDGVDGKNLSNPIPSEWQFNGIDKVPVAPIQNIKNTDPAPPFPDPGEDYPHVNIQLFYNPLNPTIEPVPYNLCPYNLPNPVPEPAMTGFVTDYILNYIDNEGEPYPSGGQTFYDQYKYVMASYDPKDIPALSCLAREFAVFDHWFCSVPSETICNRNFWHAGTSWGHVINPGPADDPKKDENNSLNTLSWLADTNGATLFSQLAGAPPPLGFKIYSENKIEVFGETLSLPVTPLLHFGNFFSFEGFDSHLHGDLDEFKKDCADGNLPSYSFIEPSFFNPHDDMHPSSPVGKIDGPQQMSSVYLGDALVKEVYNAIFTSQSWKNTLLIITFDEHGGCYDHVCPPGNYGGKTIGPPGIATPPKLGWLQKEWDGFGFDRLGLRVPTIMISPYLKKNTIINDVMSHTSFLRTMHLKWRGGVLSERENQSPPFNVPGLFSSSLERTMSEMRIFDTPAIASDETVRSQASTSPSVQGTMSPLAQAITSLVAELWGMAYAAPSLSTTKITSQDHAAAFLAEAVHRSKAELGLDAVKDRVTERDWIPLYKAMSRELKKKGMLR